MSLKCFGHLKWPYGHWPWPHGASIPSEVFLSNSIKIKKTPLISAEKPMIRCRYKGGHFKITNFIYFEYIRGVSAVIRRWVAETARQLEGGGEETQRKLRNYM